jgi:DNA-binding MarR family transcriptional regulator
MHTEDVQPLNTCISFRLGKAVQEITRRSREALSVHGVTPVQYAVLSSLWERDGMSGAEVGDRLRLDSATITGVVDRLAAAGLVERKSDPDGDRRINRLFLTREGRELRAPLGSAMAKLNRDVRRELGSDADALWRALAKVGRIGAKE